MKHISAIIMAFVITAVIGLGIMVVGVNALTNTNTVPLQNSPNGSLAANNQNASSSSSALQSTPASTDAQQLQQQVSDLQSQLDQANQAVLQYQTLLNALQQRGVIQIDSNGNVYLPQGKSGSFH